MTLVLPFSEDIYMHDVINMQHYWPHTSHMVPHRSVG